MKIKKIIKKINDIYPKKFHDFSDGEDISDKDIKKYIISCLKKVKKDMANNKKDSYHYIQTGNVFVIVFAYKNKHNKLYNVEINVSKNYKESSFFGVEF